jgi:hypothetical protein
MNKFINFFSILIALMSQVTYANSSRLLTNYPDLLSAVSQGDTVRAVIYMNKCSIKTNSTDPNDVIAGMNFTIFNKYQISVGGKQKNMIATSTNMLIEHSVLGTIYNYVRVRVFDDNTAEVYSEYLDPISYTQKGVMTANCLVSNGHDQNGIWLYDVSTV